MKNLLKKSSLVIAIIAITAYSSTAQTTNETNDSKTTKQTEMKTYLIERDIPGAGELTGADLKGISQASNAVIEDMGPGIEWIQSYVVDDKFYCVYKAENEDLIREHAKKGNFPANSIMEVENIFSPATAKN